MKKVMTGCQATILSIIILIIVGIISFNRILSDNLSKTQIFKLVDKNYNIILEDIRNNNFDNTLTIKGIREIDNENGVIDFYCGGKGMGSETSYYGFYYTQDDVPKGIFAGTKYCESEQLTADGIGYSHNEYNGDNRYYTEKIRDKFYYYEAHY